MAKAFHLTRDDKTMIAMSLLNAGVKSRIKMLRIGLRVCFSGDQSEVIRTLNDNGYLSASGRPFDNQSFNQPHEIFVIYRAA